MIDVSRVCFYIFRIHRHSEILLHIFTSSSDALKISYVFIFKIIVFT
nr:MAG TPA: hypothetical protein [Caudoviricetes sp.]